MPGRGKAIPLFYCLGINMQEHLSVGMIREKQHSPHAASKSNRAFTTHDATPILTMRLSLFSLLTL